MWNHYVQVSGFRGMLSGHRYHMISIVECLRCITRLEVTLLVSKDWVSKRSN